MSPCPRMMLGQLVAQAKQEGVGACAKYAFGPAWEALCWRVPDEENLKAINELNIDLVVMGTSAR